MNLMQDLLERLRPIVNLRSWDYCVLWKLGDDQSGCIVVVLDLRTSKIVERSFFFLFLLFLLAETSCFSTQGPNLAIFLLNCPRFTRKP
ncbi:hypothetical protein CsSME_00025660 [Camellia sinensis var. sinensis]